MPKSRTNRTLAIASLVLILGLLSSSLVGVAGARNAQMAPDSKNNAGPIFEEISRGFPSLSGKKAVDFLNEQRLSSTLKEAVKASSYRIESSGEKLIAANHDNNIRAEFDRSGFELKPASGPAWKSGWRLKSIGYGERQTEVLQGRVTSMGSRVEINREESNLVEWFENKPAGLEHGFTVEERPAGASDKEAPLRLVMHIDGDLDPIADSAGQNLKLIDDEGNTVLKYEELKVWDADNRSQTARMDVSGGFVYLEVEETNARYPLTIDPTFTETFKLTASDGSSGALFGTSVAVSGNTAIVGAPFDDVDGAVPAGAAYVYVWDGTNWTEQQKLTSSDGASGDEFGYSVAISGDTAIVGAYLDDDIGPIPNSGQASGSAYVFVRSGGVWTEQQKLISSDLWASDAFGKSVSISGDTAIISAYGNDDDGGGSGSAYIFVRSGGVWSEQQKLTASDAAGGDAFGWSVSISGDTAIVGADLDDDAGSASGSAYIFVRNGGAWTEQQKLTASDAAAGFLFGWSVSISGDTAIVGSYGNNSNGVNSGAAYIFVRSGVVWTEQQKLLASDGGTSDLFGWSVAVSGDTAIIGAMREGANGTFSGAAYTYKRIGASWTEQQKLLASDGAAQDELGFSVAVSGSTAIVGAHQDADNGSNSGSAYIYPVTTDPGFTQTDKLLAPDGTGGDGFGYSVDIEGNTAVVGAAFDVTPSNGRGSVYIFEKSGGAWILQQKLNAFDGAGNNNFGGRVSISGDTLVVSSNHDSNPGTLAGSAYVYVRSGTTWSLEQKLLPSVSTPYGSFGTDLEIDGDTIVVGEHGNSSGAAYVFVRSGTTWTEQQKLTGSATSFGENFGVGVDLDGDSVIVGAYYDDVGGASNQGSAYVFVRNGTTWTEQQILTASDGAAGDQFGFDVEISGDTAIVGSALDDVGGNSNQGSAYVYSRSGTTWTEVKKIVASDGAASDSLGSSIAIEGDKAIIGSFGDDSSQGSVYLFEKNSGGTDNWGQVSKLVASDGAANDWFGYREVASSGGNILIGAYQDDDNGFNSGSAYIFGNGTSSLTVNKTADTNDGSCTPSDCSLREAIAAANASSADDLIDFSPLFNTAQTITLGGTELTMAANGKTTIDGPGANLLTISGNDASRVFYVNDGAEVEINGVSISNGLAAPPKGGGGIFNDGGIVTVNDSEIRNNVAVQGGAGIWNGDAFVSGNAGTIVVNNSTISDNHSDTPFGGGSGGGLRNQLGNATLNNSTLSGNSGVNGGGIFNDGGGTLNLIGSTIANNSPTGNIGGVWSYGGGSLFISNTILADNTNGDCAGSNGTNYSLIEDGSCFNGSGNVSGDPNLGPLQDNGGTTFTHLPGGGSPAINAGSNALIPAGVTNDQRGSGFPRIANTTVDMGAVEVTTVTPVDQTITFDPLADKTVGDPDFTVSAIASSGLPVSFAASGDCTVAGDTVTITGVGNCTITASQAGDGTYNAAPDVDQSFAINKADQTITFGGLPDKTYGDATFNVSASASSGLPVSFAAVGFCTISGTTVTITGAGDCTINASQAGDSDYNAASDVDQTFSVAQAVLTATADDHTITYGDPDPAFTFTFSGFVNGEDASVLDDDGVVCDVAGAHTSAGSYPITCTGGSDSNYSFSYIAGTLTVDQAPQTITFGALADKTYGDASFGVAASSDSGLPVGFTAAGSCSIAGSTVTITGAGTCTVTASQSGDGNYEAADDVEQEFSIATAQLTVSPDDQSINVGDPDPVFTFSYAGFVNGEDGSVLDTAPSCGVTVPHTAAGDYAITCSGGSDGNYSFVYEGATLSVEKLDQTITFDPVANQIYGAGPIVLTATASSGLPVSYSASGACSVAGASVTITGAGSCAITASQGGDGTYNPASDVVQSFDIAKAGLTVTPDDQSIVVGSPDPVFTFTYSGFVNGEDQSVIDTEPVCEVSGPHAGVGSYTITCSGGTDDNYSFGYETGSLYVLFNFEGFFDPIDNFDTNLVKAGRAIPVKFSLNGDYGLSIIAPGYPVSYQVPCNDEEVDGTEIPTVTAGNSSLSYSPGSDTYNYVWKSEKSWEGTCRQLNVTLVDGSSHFANFKFK